MARSSNVTTHSGLMTVTSNLSLTNRERPSSKSVEQPITNPKRMNLMIGRKNWKKMIHRLSACTCPSLKIPAALSLKSPSRMTLHQVCPQRLWEVVTPRTKEAKAVKPNDCLLMQFIHEPNLQTQVHPVLSHPNLGWGQCWLMRLIPMLTHAALATIL